MLCEGEYEGRWIGRAIDILATAWHGGVEMVTLSVNQAATVKARVTLIVPSDRSRECSVRIAPRLTLVP
jgi:hypothetical protein